MINKDEILEMVYEDLEEAKQLLSFRLAEKENTEVISDRLEKLFFMADYLESLVNDTELEEEKTLTE
jgi:hypothetical protein